MNRERPAIVSTLAILNLVFGSLCGLVGMSNAAGSLCPRPVSRTTSALPGGIGGLQISVFGEPPPLPSDFSRLHTIFTTYEIWGSSMLLVNVALMIAGIGLLRMEEWGRWTSVVSASLGIALNLLFGVYQLLVVMPALTGFNQDMLTRRHQVAPDIVLTNVTRNGILIGLLLLMSYPIIVLIVMLRPSVRAAFAAPPPEEPPGGGFGGLPPSSGPGSPHVAPRRF